MTAHAAPEQSAAPQAAVAVATSLTEGAIAMQQHLMDFAARRLQRDAALWTDVARCRDAAAAAALWRDFWTETATDYAGETQALMRMAGEIGAKGRAARA